MAAAPADPQAPSSRGRASGEKSMTIDNIKPQDFTYLSQSDILYVVNDLIDQVNYLTTKLKNLEYELDYLKSDFNQYISES